MFQSLVHTSAVSQAFLHCRVHLDYPPIPISSDSRHYMSKRWMTNVWNPDMGAYMNTSHLHSDTHLPSRSTALHYPFAFVCGRAHGKFVKSFRSICIKAKPNEIIINRTRNRITTRSNKSHGSGCPAPSHSMCPPRTPTHIHTRVGSPHVDGTCAHLNDSVALSPHFPVLHRFTSFYTLILAFITSCHY